MNKDKVIKFCKDHKTELIIGGVLVGTFALGYLTKGKIVNIKNSKKMLFDLKGKKALIWEGDNGFMNLEKVKAILDANINNAEPFAIFREGPNPNDFICLTLGSDIVIPQ